MKHPERCLLVVIGCYILATILSMITDVYQEPASVIDLSQERLPKLYLNSMSNTNDSRIMNISETSISKKKTDIKTSEQPMAILIKYVNGSILNNTSSGKDILLNSTRRRMVLRKDLQNNDVVHLDYASFHIPEPSFASEEDRALFRMNKVNTEDLKPIPKERLKGAIAWVPNTTISRNIDCGWRTPLEKFQVKAYNADKYHNHIICPLLVPDGNAFQHFIDGILPKLIQAYEYIIPEDVKLLIYAPRDSIILEMLKALGFKKSQLIFYQGGIYFADVMINTCITPPLHPDLWQTARRMIGAPEELPVHPRQASVILLTRAKHHNPGRIMTNSNDVLHFLLHRYGNNAILFKGGYTVAPKY